MPDLTVEQLRGLLKYDPETGVLTWLVSGRRMKPRAGEVAGCADPRGYIQIRINRRLYWAHRLALAIVNGEWPDGEVDHLDGDKGNNRLSNLRVGTKATNMQNLRRAMTSNKSSGLLGAHWNKERQKWKAAITVDGRTVYLGLFDTAQAAHTAYVQAKRQHHEGCTL